MAVRVIAPPSEKPSSLVRWLKNERNWMPYLFVAPFFLTFIVFSLYPLITSLIMPFQKAVGFEGKFAWVGLANFQEMFVGQFTREGYLHAFRNFVYFGIGSLATQMPSAFIIALLLSSSRLRLKGLWRSLLFIPGMLPVVTIVVLGGWFFNPTRGLINAILGVLGMDPINY